MTEVVVDNGEKLQGTVGDVDGSIASEMMEFFRAPVAGGNPIRILYALTMLACIVLFISSLATAAPSWAEPVTSVKTVLTDSIPLPDVYMCYDSEFASLFADGFLKAQYVTRTLNG